MTPAVYRNPRYEHALASQAMQLAALWEAMEALRQALMVLHSQVDPENHIPALRELPRAFGMGH